MIMTKDAGLSSSPGDGEKSLGKTDLLGPPSPQKKILQCSDGAGGCLGHDSGVWDYLACIAKRRRLVELGSNLDLDIDLELEPSRRGWTIAGDVTDSNRASSGREYAVRSTRDS